MVAVRVLVFSFVVVGASQVVAAFVVHCVIVKVEEPVPLEAVLAFVASLLLVHLFGPAGLTVEGVEMEASSYASYLPSVCLKSIVSLCCFHTHIHQVMSQ